jgi:hypothetical protein
MRSSAMMLFAHAIALASISIMFANAVSVPRASSGKCHTIATGYLSTLISGKWLLVLLAFMRIDFLFPDNSGDKQLSLNSAEELTYNSGTVFRAAFQVSPRSRNERLAWT